MFTGSVEYTLVNKHVLGMGISFTQDELDLALNGPVAEIVFDTEETTFLKTLVESVPDTDFKPGPIQRVLTTRTIPKNWRVGEALAEAYLVHNHTCQFPWPNSRDERRSNSSLPGADLVGFQKDGATHRFVFGEVKTSCEIKYPPGVMYGRSGLKQQIEDLKENEERRDKLVKYLMHRAVKSTWFNQFVEAARRYFSNSTDIQIFGILVRDVPPNRDDLHHRTNDLAQNCLIPMSIFLFALYLPEKSIPALSNTVMRLRKNGGNK